MDLFEEIQRLYAEKESLLRAIAALEALRAFEARAGDAQAVERRSKRGRKSMDSEERQEVSRRMKKYWASRRMAGSRQVKTAGVGMCSAAGGSTGGAPAAC